MNTAEIVYELVKTMPEEQANTVLKFAKFLKQEANQSLDTHQDLGWEPGFFEKTAGCLADDPIIRYPQPPYNVRETIA